MQGGPRIQNKHFRRLATALDPLSKFRAGFMGAPALVRGPDFKRIRKKVKLVIFEALATPQPRSNSIRWLQFFAYSVAQYLESSKDKPLTGQGHLLDRWISEGKPEDFYRLTFLQALSLQRARYWVFLLTLLARWGLWVDLEEEEQELETGRSSEEPPPRPVVTATVTLKTISPTAPNATA